MDVTSSFKALVKGLFEDKQCLKDLEDAVKASSEEVKNEMTRTKQQEVVVDDIKVTYKPSERTSMDEGVLLQLLKVRAEKAERDGQLSLSDSILGCIRTREYVDSEALETLLYEGRLQPEEIAPASVSSTVWTLRLSQIRPRKQ